MPEDIKNGDPVFTSGFHAGLGTAIMQEPVVAGNEVRVESGEPLFLIRGNAFEVSSGDIDSDKFFVDVHTGTVEVNNTQHKKASFQKKHALTDYPAKQKRGALLNKD